MKTQNIIRILAGLSLLILFCPFLKTCGFVREEATTVETESPEFQHDTIVVQHPDSVYTTTDTLSDGETGKKIEAENRGKEVTASGWEFAITPFENFPDSFFSLLLFFTGCGLSSILMFVFAITKKLRVVNIIAWSSGLLALSPLLIIVVLDGNIDIVSDIRYGYTLYIINSIAIIVFSKKAIKQNAI